MPRSRGTLFFLLFVAALSARPAFAAEGRTPVFLPGTVLTQDGKYVVTRPLVGGGGGPVLTVSGGNVDLDLNGMVLSNAGSANPIISTAAGVQHLTIRNGTLASGSVGIDIAAARKVDIEDVKIKDMLVAPGQGIHLGEVRVAVIRRVEIMETIGEGILWDGSSPAVNRQASIEDNLLQRTASGIVLTVPGAFGGAVVNNRVMDSMPFGIGAFPGYGIVLAGFNGTLVSQNTVQLAQQDGMFFRQCRGLKVYNNDVSFSFGNGIHLDQQTFGSLILDNVAQSNGIAQLPSGGSGLLIEGPNNMIQGNALNDNAGFGLQFCVVNTSCGNTFGRNTARNNQGVVLGPCAGCGGAPALFPPNSCNVFCGGGVAPNSTFGDNLIPGPPIF